MSKLAKRTLKAKPPKRWAKSIGLSSLSRREFLKSAFVSGAAAIVSSKGFSRGSLLGAGSEAEIGKDGGGIPVSTTRPNIVYIFSDQHRNCSWSGGGTEQIQTPNLNKLASQGVVFTNCISNYPLCSPHRASLLTGRFPQANMITSNVNKDYIQYPLPTTEPSIARVFRDAGYATGYVGKWHLFPGATTGTVVPPGDHRHGFDDYWRACHYGMRWYDTRTYDDDGAEIVLPGYAPAIQMDMVISFIQEHASKPFCIFLSWVPPHPPFTMAPSGFEELYPIEQIQIRPNVPEDQTLPDLLENHRGYYAHISALDYEIGVLIKHLEQMQLADNTIVVYSSDHGGMLGSMGYYGKGKPWEESINVPFIIRWPNGIQGNRRLNTLFSTVDIAPTLLSLAGMPVPGRMQGHDLSHVLKGQPGSTPDSALIMRITEGNIPNEDLIGDWRGVRTLDYTYARRREEAEVKPWLLYDLQKDPYQMTNLINDPDYMDIRDELDAILRDWLIQLGDYEYFGAPFSISMPIVYNSARQLSGPHPNNRSKR